MSAHKNCQCSLHLVFSESYQETLVFKRGHQITFLYSDRPFLLCERIINDVKCLRWGGEQHYAKLG